MDTKIQHCSLLYIICCCYPTRPTTLRTQKPQPVQITGGYSLPILTIVYMIGGFELPIWTIVYMIGGFELPIRPILTIVCMIGRF